MLCNGVLAYLSTTRVFFNICLPSARARQTPPRRANSFARKLSYQRLNAPAPDAPVRPRGANRTVGEALGHHYGKGRFCPFCAGRQGPPAAARGRRRFRRGRVRRARALCQGVAPGTRGHKAPPKNLRPCTPSPRNNKTKLCRPLK